MQDHQGWVTTVSAVSVQGVTCWPTQTAMAPYNCGTRAMGYACSQYRPTTKRGRLAG